MVERRRIEKKRERDRWRQRTGYMQLVREEKKICQRYFGSRWQMQLELPCQWQLHQAIAMYSSNESALSIRRCLVDYWSFRV